MKETIFISISLLFGALVSFAALEIVLRFLPVCDSFKTKSTTASDPIARFQPDRSGIYSKYWNFKHATPFYVNNDGFVNDQNYTTTDPRPLIAVVGDSYVEAAIVGYKNSYAGLLSQNDRVYTFAASGAPLSQYLVWAKYAKERYNNDYLIISVVSNDFDESLMEYKSAPPFHYYIGTGGGQLGS